MCSEFLLSSNEGHAKAYLENVIDLFDWLVYYAINFLYYARVFGKGEGW